MKNLQEKVEKMLEGEKKRREIALKFLDELQEIIYPVAETIWGEEGDGEYYIPNSTYCVWVRNFDEKKQKNIATCVYFDYGYDSKEFYHTREEFPGNGSPVKYLKGIEFWHCIQQIINWIPVVIKAMEKRELNRENLLKKINIE